MLLLSQMVMQHNFAVIAWQAAHVFTVVQALQVVISHCLALERLLVVLVHALQNAN
jgi:hypothetical protein